MKLEFNYMLLFTENSKLAPSLTTNITFVVRAVNRKIEVKTHKVPVTNGKVPVTTLFRNVLVFSILPLKILEKMTLKFLIMPVTIFDSMVVRVKSARDKIQNYVCHGHFGVSRKKKAMHLSISL